MNPSTTKVKTRWLRPLTAWLKRHASTRPAFDKAKAGLMLLTIAALSVMMSVHLRQDRVALRLGETSTREVRSPRSVIYLDSEKTATLQKIAGQATRPVYDVDERAAINARRTVDELFDRLDMERRASSTRALLKTANLDKAVQSLQAGSGLSRATLRRLLTVPPTVFQRLRDTTTRLVDEGMDREIRDQSDDLRQVQQTIRRRAQETLPVPGDADFVVAVAGQALRPNRLYSRARTQQAKQAAMHSVPSAYGRLFPGDKIIAQGDVVRLDTLDKLTALGLLDPRQELTTGVAICILAAVMVLVVAFYISRLLPDLYKDTRRLALLSVIVLLSVVGLKVGATLLGLQFAGWQLGYLGMMSVTAAGMLVSVLLDMHLAMLIVALLAIQSGMIMNHEIRFSVMTLLSGLVGIASVSHVRHKTNLLATTAALALSNVGLVWLLGLLFNDGFRELLTGSAWAMGVAPFATFLFWFGVLALEKPFGILTHTSLLEMSAFDRPLLKQLCAVAPGTYAHSMMVGTLAEAGAQAIHADALLCRVGGYYHDIGKMNRPDFFIENQRADNVHCRLSPSLSALIITAHVRDGVTMAKQHRLPDEIRDIIAQHHGTTLISFFYRQALADNGGSSDGLPPGMEERFRYPGPKPQTREAAIVMLADSVEAAARCIDKPNQEKIEALITSIVRGKIEDGQLDECPLTFRDVKHISDAFLHVLQAMMHGRIDYPKESPRTASGQPMEVVRADLRPEAPALELPLKQAQVTVRADVSRQEAVSTAYAPDTLVARSLNDDAGKDINGIAVAPAREASANEVSTAILNPLTSFAPTPLPAPNDGGVAWGEGAFNSPAVSGLGNEANDLRSGERNGEACVLPHTDGASSEIFYGRPYTEPTVAPAENSPASPGRAAPASVGRPRPRGGKRGSDR